MSASAGARGGRPARAVLVAGYFVAALACWLAATFALLAARNELVAGAVWAPRVLLALHLVALGFLPLAVVGGALHILSRVEVVVDGGLAGSSRLVVTGSLLLLGAAAAACGGALFTIRAGCSALRPRPATSAARPA